MQRLRCLICVALHRVMLPFVLTRFTLRLARVFYQGPSCCRLLFVPFSFQFAQCLIIKDI